VNADELFTATLAWRAAYPGAVAGVLAMRGVANPEAHPALDAARERLETELRARYAGMTRAEIRAGGHFPAYDAYYRRFGQTYHVLLQVDSIALKGKPIPRRAGLVEAAFMAEVATGILTASHDLDALALPVAVDVATGDETYVLYNGSEQVCKPNDMLMRDRTGILTTVISGPATYALITPATTAALFCIYAPPGIGEPAVRDHLGQIESNVRLMIPDADTAGLVTIAAAP
jgi:DNA/RNA-binding domain of Phe-tRNA-synthetase-like protein